MNIDSVNLPFLGSRRRDHISFQYLLQNIQEKQIVIAMPAWVMSREVLREGDEINYHLPFYLNELFFTRGIIRESYQDQEMNARIFLTDVTQAQTNRPRICFTMSGEAVSIDLQQFDGSSEEMLTHVMKESLLIKKGVQIYLGHLIPYFSRIGDYPRQDYILLREQLLNDIRGKVAENIKNLEECFQKITTRCCRLVELAEIIDLETLRSFVESEINSDIFQMTFDNEQVMKYIVAIKTLEEKLYDNYNTIVMLYVRSL
jgi:hypothetical protein